jgi:hypothetical protein
VCDRERESGGAIALSTCPIDFNAIQIGSVESLFVSAKEFRLILTQSRALYHLLNFGHVDLPAHA